MDHARNLYEDNAEVIQDLPIFTTPKKDHITSITKALQEIIAKNKGANLEEIGEQYFTAFKDDLDKRLNPETSQVVNLAALNQNNASSRFTGPENAEQQKPEVPGKGERRELGR